MISTLLTHLRSLFKRGELIEEEYTLVLQKQDLHVPMRYTGIHLTEFLNHSH